MKSILFVFAFVMSFASVGYSQSSVLTEPIINFHQVTEGIYRGSRPLEGQVQLLADMGIKTVINIQGGDIKNPLIGFAVPWFVKGESEQEILAEGEAVVAAGMQYHSFPLSSLKPVNRKEAAYIAQVLEMMADPTKQPVYVHCAHGKDRTGLVVALYRMIYQDWSLQQAHAEMIAKGHKALHMAMTFSLDQYLYTYAFVSYIDELLRDLAARRTLQASEPSTVIEPVLVNP